MMLCRGTCEQSHQNWGDEEQAIHSRDHPTPGAKGVTQSWEQEKDSGGDRRRPCRHLAVIAPRPQQRLMAAGSPHLCSDTGAARRPALCSRWAPRPGWWWRRQRTGGRHTAVSGPHGLFSPLAHQSALITQDWPFPQPGPYAQTPHSIFAISLGDRGSETPSDLLPVQASNPTRLCGPCPSMLPAPSAPPPPHVLMLLLLIQVDCAPADVFFPVGLRATVG